MAARNTKPAGRKAGSKNRATLMKQEVLERLTKQAQGYLIHEVQTVLETVVQRAVDGDMTAAKLVLERAIPARRSIDEVQTGGVNIQINIVGDEDGIDQKRSHEDQHQPGPAHREADPGTKGGQVVTVIPSEVREWEDENSARTGIESITEKH